MIRTFDLIFSLFGLILTCPIIITALFLIYLTDRQPPIYIAKRVGLNGREFRMYKMRTMVANAENLGGSSTASSDSRITPVGKWLRRFKIDELTQLVNVLIGDMSVVGPRPNVRDGGTDLYTDEEKKILSVRPGITDFSSIVFSDEGEILMGMEDPDLAYNQLIRPWKSRLALLYIANISFALNIKIIFLTIGSIGSRQKTLLVVHKLLQKLNADKKLLNVVARNDQLVPYPPPGSTKIVTEC